MDFVCMVKLLRRCTSSCHATVARSGWVVYRKVGYASGSIRSSGPWLAQLVLIDHSTLHYELHVLQLFYVFQRVAADGYDVRPLASFDGSQLVPPAEQLSSSRSSRAARLQPRHSVFHV